MPDFSGLSGLPSLAGEKGRSGRLAGIVVRVVGSVRPTCRPVPPARLADLLLPDPELADELWVALRVLLLQVVEQASALPDQLQQAAARVVILRVGLEVLGQVVDALAQDGYLHFRRAGIGLVSAVGPNNFRLAILR